MNKKGQPMVKPKPAKPAAKQLEQHPFRLDPDNDKDRQVLQSLIRRRALGEIPRIWVSQGCVTIEEGFGIPDKLLTRAEAIELSLGPGSLEDARKRAKKRRANDLQQSDPRRSRRPR
jgi:hypothetical protein